MKQGRHIWYENIKAQLISMGYHNTQADYTIFMHSADPHFSIIALYVDNITMASTSSQEIECDKALLCQHYEITDLGDLTWILRIYIICDRTAGWISLLQEKYSTEVLKRFGKSTVCTISTPTLVNEHLCKHSKSESNLKPYQSAVGALMYPMLGTQPNLAYAVAALRQYNATPGMVHFQSLD
jgi:Reverse transcriptase (RNA-dependent DNA polymerase)